MSGAVDRSRNEYDRCVMLHNVLVFRHDATGIQSDNTRKIDQRNRNQDLQDISKHLITSLYLNTHKTHPR